MVSENLKRLAVLLREKAAAETATTQVKCAQVLQAATALHLLREKVAYVR